MMRHAIDTSSYEQHERRSQMRVSVDPPGGRACKVYNSLTDRYAAGRVIDLSEGGAALVLTEQTNVRVGDRVLLGIANKRREMILSHERMVESEIVRKVETTDGRVAVAVRFVEPNAVEESSLVRLAGRLTRRAA